MIPRKTMALSRREVLEVDKNIVHWRRKSVCQIFRKAKRVRWVRIVNNGERRKGDGR